MTFVAAAADSDGGVNPLFFVLGALALIVVSTLGPLSRLHERRDEATEHARKPDPKRPAAPADVVSPDVDTRTE